MLPAVAGHHPGLRHGAVDVDEAFSDPLRPRPPRRGRLALLHLRRTADQDEPHLPHLQRGHQGDGQATQLHVTALSDPHLHVPGVRAGGGRPDLAGLREAGRRVPASQQGQAG